MKKILSTLAVVFLLGLSATVKAQCPPSMPLIAGDTNYVYNGVGTTFNSGTTLACNAMPFYVWANEPSTLSNPITDIFTSCIKTDYNLYWTTERTRGTETVYEGGTNIGCVGPSGCSFPIGGTVPPGNGTAVWDLYWSYLDITQQHDHVFSKTAGTWNGPPTITLQDCWSGATLPSVVATPVSWPSATTSFTATTAANTNIGTCSYSLTPAVPGAIVDIKIGYVYVRPNVLPVGTYTLTYNFSNSVCAGTTSQFVFTITNPYTATWTAPTNLCNSGSCVSLPPTVTGTSGGTWSGTGVAGTTFCPATSGAGSWPVTYSVGISATCNATQTNSISVTATPTLTVAGGNLCSGQSIVLTNTGSSASSYTWSPSGGSASSATVSPTSTTTYTLTGANGVCTRTTTATVNVTATPTLAVTGGNICSGQSIVLTNTGAGSGSNTYTWSPSGGNANSATVTPTSTTIYTLNAANGACTKTTTATVNVTATPTLAVTGGSICSGQSIVLTNTGSTAAGYTWSPSGGSASSATVSPTTNTTYTLTGANGTCTANTTAAVNVTATPTLAVTGGSICSGNSIVLTNTGSSAGGYTWSPSGGSANSATVSPTSTQVYTLTGANGTCTGTTTATVNVTATPTLSVAGGTICAGGNIVLTNTGSSATGYTWSPSGGSASSATVSPSGSTTYTLTGANGTCTANTTAAVNVTPNPTVSIASTGGTTICSGTSTTLTASGATNYTWSPNAGGGNGGSVVVSPTSSDTYTVTGESSGCSSTQVITVNVTPTPTVLANSNSGTLCAGQSTVLTASGASNYTWMPGGLTTTTISVSPGSTTVYTVTGNNSGCISTQTVAVNVNPLPTISLSAAPPSLCTGQTTTITVSGASTYTWSANAGGGNATSVSVTPGATDTYTVSGTDANGCINTNTLTVAVGAGATISITAASNTVCSGQSITLNGGGATNYTWTPGGQNTATVSVTPGSTTTYTLTGDNGGCTGTQTVTVNVTPTPTVLASASSTSACSAQTTTLTASGATNYTWMPGGSTTATTTVNPSSTTVYTLTGESGGCTSTSPVTINVTTTPTLAVSAASGTICAGQSTTLNGSGATNYTWSPGAINTATTSVTPGTSTIYTLTGTNGNCVATETVAVNVTALPNVTASSSSTNGICSGQNAVLTGAGASTYTWMPGGANTSTISVNPGSTTVYTLTGTANGCDNSTQVTVNVTTTPTLAITASSGTICVGQSTTLNGSGATNYTWTPGGANGASTSVSPGSNTTYTVVGETSGCTDTSVVNVTVNPTPTLGNSPVIDSALCGKPTGAVTGINVTGGTPNYTYQWYNNGVLINGANGATLNNVPAGNYSVVVTDANGCVANGGVASFTVPGSSAVVAGITPPLSQGQAPLNVTFGNNTSGATVYGWNFGNGTSTTGTTPTATYNAPGTYTVTMIASNGGCADTTYAVVIVDMPTHISVPNVFSPNSDGINDEFFIINTGLTSLNCDIYNRWGQKMYTITAPQGKWDGVTNNGAHASDGTYYFVLKAVGLDGKTYEQQGYVTLVR